MKDLECINKIEYLLKRSYYVIDILPEQVPGNSKGQFFEVEKFYLSKEKLKDLLNKTKLLAQANGLFVWKPKNKGR